jgi:Zn-dependent protease with chaperone function
LRPWYHEDVPTGDRLVFIFLATQPIIRSLLDMKGIFLFMMLFNAALGYAQLDRNFMPLRIQDTIPSNLYPTLKARLDEDIKNVSVKGKSGSYMRLLYEQRFDYIVKTFNGDFVMVGDELTNYLQRILTNIYEANPDLPREIRIFGYRDDSPNAFGFGEGTLAIMLGLISRIESEDVLAYVLCHEIAHYQARHTQKQIEKLVALNYDKVLKKQINEIMSSPYGRYSKLKTLFNSLDMSLSKHSRSAEFEADSLGLTYYRNTSYHPFGPLRCMQILKQADSSTFTGTIDYKKYFSFTEFPFKDSWINYKKSDVWHAEKTWIIPDSARTHPHCENRFDALRKQIDRRVTIDSNLAVGKIIPEVMDKAAFELINTHYHFKEYGKGLFRALTLAERFPDNIYAHAMIVKCLYQLYKAQKNHSLGKHLELPDPRFPENYDRFLSFNHALRLFEMANIAYHYAISRPEHFYQDEEFVHALWMVSKFDFSKVDAEKVRDDYEEMFPNGKYLNEMRK